MPGIFKVNSEHAASRTSASSELSKRATQQSPSPSGSPVRHKVSSVEEAGSPFTQRKFPSLSRSLKPIQ